MTTPDHDQHIPGRDERGVITLMVVILMVAMVAFAGLVIDAGYAAAGNRRLTNQAQQAARVGADALEPDSLRDGGTPTVDRAQAIALAQQYLNQIDAPPATVTVDGDTVTVEIHSRTKTAILSAVGVTSLPISGHASARSIDADDTP